jgi:5-formyltetrahydrofolate cyclo-ligase
MNKDDLRKYYIEKRDSIPDRIDRSNLIYRRIIKHKEFINAKVIGIYNDFGSEVITKGLINYSLSIKKRVCLPKTFKGKIEFYEIKSMDNLKKGFLGIDEPEEDVLIDKNIIDLMIVPGISFDLKKNRLGHGSGYYDKYLRDFKGYKIGILFKEQLSLDQEWVITFDSTNGLIIKHF